MKIRKITRTKSGSTLINLYGVIPEDWDYIEVIKGLSTEDSIQLTLYKVEVGKVANKVSRKLSAKTPKSD
jgi:hypothetical protein